jgi:hypothetical protein
MIGSFFWIPWWPLTQSTKPEKKDPPNLMGCGISEGILSMFATRLEKEEFHRVAMLWALRIPLGPWVKKLRALLRSGNMANTTI